MSMSSGVSNGGESFTEYARPPPIRSKQREEEEEQDHPDDERLFFYTDSEIPDEGGRHPESIVARGD